MNTPLNELTLEELELLWADLHSQRSELKALIAQTRRDWLNERKHTPFAVRVDMDAELADIRAEIAAVESQMKSRKEESIAMRTLDFWHWSDQMLAAVTFLLEAEGNTSLLKKAKKMVSDGWPNKTT